MTKKVDVRFRLHKKKKKKNTVNGKPLLKCDLFAIKHSI